jgi:polyisoprenoid-binding protein YceI
MKHLIAFFILSLSISAFAQEAGVTCHIKPGNSAFIVRSTEVKGTAVKKGDEVEAKDIIVGLKNVTTGLSMRDTHTKKYLEVEKFPEATLVSAKGKGGKGEGIVRIHGIEKPVTGTYKIEGNKMTAEFPIKISDFGITGVRYMSMGVVDDANVVVTVPVTEAAAPAASAPVKKK